MKKHQHLTFYLLVDGTHADPDDCARGADGVLRHENGLAVAIREDGNPSTIGVDAVDNKNVEAAQMGEPDPNTQPPPPSAPPQGDLLAETTDKPGQVEGREVLTNTPNPVAMNREMTTAPAAVAAAAVKPAVKPAAARAATAKKAAAKKAPAK